ncbi:MAG: hypothetical protein C0516_07800 [Gemmatimonas sp.]|nr:hypothetical protein [Gemmatimonas sp.]
MNLLRLRHSLAAIAVVFVTATSLAAQSPRPMSPPSAPGNEQLYTVLIYERSGDLAQRTDPRQADAYWGSYDRYAALLAEKGVLRGGSALDETVQSTVRGKGSADRAVSGARLGGYFVIAAASLAEAERLARLAPPAAVAVELRPHRDNPHMATAPTR